MSILSISGSGSQVYNFAELIKGFKPQVVRYGKRTMAFVLFFISTIIAKAQDMTAGTKALQSVTDSFKTYIPIVTDLCYVLAGLVVIVGAISTFIAMNNGEQDVKKRIMMIIGSCAFLVAAAVFLPKFFGL